MESKDRNLGPAIISAGLGVMLTEIAVSASDNERMILLAGIAVTFYVLAVVACFRAGTCSSE